MLISRGLGVAELPGKLDTVVVLVSDWPGAVRWYTQKLGLRLLYKEDDDQWCQLAFPKGETRLALYHRDGLDSKIRNRCIPDIQVDNLESAVKELRSRGVSFPGDIRGGDEGYRIISLLDPEGNELQLYEYAKTKA